MKIATVKEFRDHASKLLRSPEPVFITRNGKAAGFYIPLADDELPVDLKREIFHQLTEHIRKLREEKGITEEEILDDFEAHRKNRRRR